ncbi:HNH endonuclease signature motif containing protein [Nocardioides sp.]|uniref:HNH endonuclease signature motif containing protein n=1 Tax=Nocardioides sp. TaxID=35761 RepID=UPI0026142171|nr:HNH endonuclease signature motif containing protein [Nocardioides sp.]MDI6908926.1 HNH endonuclease signature motif containing protein [Nocardioides sp.]
MKPAADTARDGRTDQVLGAARAVRADLTALEARRFEIAAQWAELHPGEEVDQSVPWEERELEIAGEGAPTVAEFCIAELAATLGMSTDAGRNLVGDAVETQHRLPRLWARVMALEVPVWRARRVAQLTASLSVEAAAYVDRHLAAVIDKCSYAQIERTVEAARTSFDPEAELARTVEDHLEVRITHAKPALGETPGTACVDAILTTADALDLETAVADIAHRLLASHPDASLDTRRALALGILARGEHPGGSSREVVIYTHHRPAEGPGIIGVDNTRAWVTLDQLSEWCTTAGTKVTIKPVLDLADELFTDHYEPTPAQHEQAILTHPTCVFPACSRPSRGCDLDHIIPWPLGPTATWNLAPLCRFHHRLKTTGGWTYQRQSPTSFEWTSPHHRTYLVTSSRHIH